MNAKLHLLSNIGLDAILLIWEVVHDTTNM